MALVAVQMATIKTSRLHNSKDPTPPFLHLHPGCHKDRHLHKLDMEDHKTFFLRDSLRHNHKDSRINCHLALDHLVESLVDLL
jgi:hypothetical protein